VQLTANVDAAIAKNSGVDWVVVVKAHGAPVDMSTRAISAYTTPPRW